MESAVESLHCLARAAYRRTGCSCVVESLRFGILNGNYNACMPVCAVLGMIAFQFGKLQRNFHFQFLD